MKIITAQQAFELTKVAREKLFTDFRNEVATAIDKAICAGLFMLKFDVSTSVHHDFDRLKQELENAPNGYTVSVSSDKDHIIINWRVPKKL